MLPGGFRFPPLRFLLRRLPESANRSTNIEQPVANPATGERRAPWRLRE